MVSILLVCGRVVVKPRIPGPKYPPVQPFSPAVYSVEPVRTHHSPRHWIETWLLAHDHSLSFQLLYVICAKPIRGISNSLHASREEYLLHRKHCCAIDVYSLSSADEKQHLPNLILLLDLPILLNCDPLCDVEM